MAAVRIGNRSSTTIATAGIMADDRNPPVSPGTKPRHSVLIVDDDPSVHELVARVMQDYRLINVHHGWQCVDTLEKENIDVVILDLTLAEDSGLDVLADMRKQGDEIPVFILTSYADPARSRRAMDWGAQAVMEKTYATYSRLPHLIAAALRRPRRHPTRRQWNTYRHDHFLFNLLEQSYSLAINVLLRRARAAALMPAPIFIQGQPGSDRLTIARYVHAIADRGRFIDVTAHPSEEFNHILSPEPHKNLGDPESLLLAADGGCLFIDQIHHLSRAAQKRLVQWLRDSDIEPSSDGAHSHPYGRGPSPMGTANSPFGGGGANRDGLSLSPSPSPSPSMAVSGLQCQLIAASTEPLSDMLADQRLDPVLGNYFRSASLTLPPLRERQADLATGAAELLDMLARELGVPAPKLSDDALVGLCEYSFPGNEQELMAILTTACLRKPGQVLDVQDVIPTHSST